MAPISLYTSFYTSLVKSLLSLIFARLYPTQRPPARDLSGQTAIVTGANSGIGLSIATSLAQQGATVFLACRSLERGATAMTSITQKAGEKTFSRVHLWQLDTSSLSSVRTFCSKWKQEGKKIDMLVHNAGIASPPKGSAKLTDDGLELVYATNFLGGFLMTRLLSESLSETARVVFTSSVASYSGFTVLADAQPKMEDTAVYGRTKAQQVLLARALQNHFDEEGGSGRSAHAFSPGFTSTAIFGKYEVGLRTWVTDPILAILKTTEKYVAVDTDEGAKTGAWLASNGDRLEGGRLWEWMTRRTSIVDMLQGSLGEEKFWRVVRKQWNRWEEDAKVEWDVKI